MGDLYKRIEILCNNKGVTITTMCKESGASRASLTDLKKGRKQSLSAETLAKIASYFEVSIDYLLTGEETKKAPAQEGERQINDEDIKVALFKGDAENITDEMWEEVKRYANYLLHQKENKNKEDQK